MQVLPRQGDEFDAASVPLQCISQGGGLRRGDGGIAILLPDAEQRLEAWCAIGLSRINLTADRTATTKSTRAWTSAGV